MKCFILFISFFITYNPLSYTQESITNIIDKDKKSFEENVFNQQFEEYIDTTDLNRKLYDRIPEKLPEWVFSPIEFGNSIRVVGFSDPNMEKDIALQQAIHRAKAMYALLNKSTISNITDDYTNMRESGKHSLYSTKFQDFSLSKVVLPYNNSSVSVIDTFYTKYQEGIVLLEIDYNGDADPKQDTIEVKGEHLQIMTERSFKNEKIEFFNLQIIDKKKIDSIDLISQYNFKIVNQSYNISSIHGNMEFDFTERTYNYRTDLDFEKDSLDSEFNYFRLSRGLWNGYISGILSRITVLSKLLASQVKNSNDFYTLKNEGLIRTVARKKIAFGFNDFKMIQNQFYIDLSGEIKY